MLLVIVATRWARGDEVDFAREILPILSNKCFVCHGPDSQDEDQLRLDSAEFATADRGGYRAIDAKSPADSALLLRIQSEDDPMPPEDAEKQLTDQERALLTRWVQQGGTYDQHWAFLRPRKADSAPNRKVAIDHYVKAQLEERGIDFAPRANRRDLARRAALILTGLPPEPTQLQGFLSDDQPDAFARFVDQLLQDPRYGEHQARYWLDAVRYGDTHGLHLDNRRGIYPYRDWVVRAFNDNLPLDEFIEWQLAGDLLPNPTMEQRIATGFVRMNPSTSEGGAIPAEFQAKNNFDRTETLGTVLLGMSLTCARCHTHKYDPITQTEYYQLLAFFNSTAERAMDGNSYTYGPTLKVPENQHDWQRWTKLTARRDELVRQLDEQCRGSVELTEEQAAKWHNGSPGDRLQIAAAEGSAFMDSPMYEPAVALAKRIADAEKAFTTTLVAKDLDEPRTTRILRRGEYDQPIGDPLRPDVLAVMGDFPDDAPRNRLGLSQWLTSPEHPLVARVLINRIWQRTFGYGLVRTPEDFGVQGQQPTHPELLDWLAVEFQESGWDLKHMLRLMVGSRTFQQSSAWREEVRDPENRLFARGPSHRLDAEVIRDIALWSSGLLQSHMGGEGVKPYQPDGMWMALAHPASNTKKYQQDTGDLLYRRSLYVYWKRTSPHPMMTLFDAPDRESSCVRRSRTNTSLQSLGLLNETQRTEMARKLAGRLMRQRDGDPTRLDLLFELLACRGPNSAERAACHELLESMRQRYATSDEDARALLSIGEAPRDTELDPVEQAAWTQVAAMVMASDVAILLY